MNGQKRFNEYFAKIILEYCYKDKYLDLAIADKPDLREIHSKIGIEVAYSMEKDRVEAIKLKTLIPYCDEDKKIKLQNKLDTIRNRHKNSNYEWEYNNELEKGIENSYLREIFECVKNKVEKLNNKNANYDELDSYELFINSAVPIDEFGQQCEVLNKLYEINIGEKQYSFIHIMAFYDLITFDMISKDIKRKKLYFVYDRLGEKAKELMIRKLYC